LYSGFEMSERKAWIVVAVFALASLIVIGSLWLVYSAKHQAGGSDFVFYYSIDCPHCKNVEDFVTANNITMKISIINKEVSQDESNRNELIAVSTSCGIASGQLGVPLGYYQKKCYVGEDENKAILAQLAGVAVQ
jgi:phage FluMu protein Com